MQKASARNSNAWRCLEIVRLDEVADPGSAKTADTKSHRDADRRPSKPSCSGTLSQFCRRLAESRAHTPLRPFAGKAETSAAGFVTHARGEMRRKGPKSTDISVMRRGRKQADARTDVCDELSKASLCAAQDVATDHSARPLPAKSCPSRPLQRAIGRSEGREERRGNTNSLRPKARAAELRPSGALAES